MFAHDDANANDVIDMFLDSLDEVDDDVFVPMRNACFDDVMTNPNEVINAKPYAKYLDNLHVGDVLCDGIFESIHTIGVDVKHDGTIFLFNHATNLCLKHEGAMMLSHAMIYGWSFLDDAKILLVFLIVPFGRSHVPYMVFMYSFFESKDEKMFEDILVEEKIQMEFVSIFYTNNVADSKDFPSKLVSSLCPWSSNMLVYSWFFKFILYEFKWMYLYLKVPSLGMLLKNGTLVIHLLRGEAQRWFGTIITFGIMGDVY